MIPVYRQNARVHNAGQANRETTMRRARPLYAKYLVTRLDRLLVLVAAFYLPELDDRECLAIVYLLRRLHDHALFALEIEKVALAQLARLSRHAALHSCHRSA